jgi:uncharacterized protein (TIGR03067 family)
VLTRAGCEWRGFSLSTDRLRPIATCLEGQREQVPHHINIDFVEGPEAGNRCEGLFELDGDRFRLCVRLVGGISRPALAPAMPWRS